MKIYIIIFLLTNSLFPIFEGTYTGGAFTKGFGFTSAAYTDDVTSVILNPALEVSQNRISISTTEDIFGNLILPYYSIVAQINLLNLLKLNGGIWGYSPDLSDFNQMMEQKYFLGLGANINNNLRIGINLEYYNWTVKYSNINYFKNIFNLDIGLFYKTKLIDYGITLNNILPYKISLFTGDKNLLSHIFLSLNIKQNFANLLITLQFNYQYNNSFNNTMKSIEEIVHIAIYKEIFFNSTIASGFSVNDSFSILNFSISLKTLLLNKYYLSYAYKTNIFLSNLLIGKHSLSLDIKL